jgi:hypothetical protein
MTSSDRWAGYYYYFLDRQSDPPMFFKLGFVPPPTVINDFETTHRVYFCGEGADSVGSFFLEGSADMHTGTVAARKSYVGAHWWHWRGVITPFGMVGVWGTDTDSYGWWWIWPREWSEGTPTSQAAATLTVIVVVDRR